MDAPRVSAWTHGTVAVNGSAGSFHFTPDFQATGVPLARLSVFLVRSKEGLGFCKISLSLVQDSNL